MKNKIFSIVCTLAILCSMFLGVSVSTEAEEDNKDIMIDGSLLTNDDCSTGTITSLMQRGKHLMDGESGISKAGNGRIYAYGQTTANHDVDLVSVLMYVERLNESKEWAHVKAYTADARDAYYVIVDDTLKVDRGYYYRVRCEHFAGNIDEEFYDEAFSVTDGIMIP